MDKYPNVVLTQGLIDLSRYSQPEKKLRVISQILDEPDGLDQVGEPVEMTKNPLVDDSDPMVGENTLPPHILRALKDGNLTLKDILSEDSYYNNQPPGNDFEIPDEDSYPVEEDLMPEVPEEQPKTWQDKLKQWFSK